VDVRLVAVTNANIKLAMREGRFREDLYYRVGLVTIAVPPLRDRDDDVTLLATAFLEYAAETRRRVQGFSRNALAAIESCAWPGNVRELENRVKRAVVMAEGTRITASDLELDSPMRLEGRSLRDVRAELEREALQRALDRNKGNLSRTALELGVSRRRSTA